MRLQRLCQQSLDTDPLQTKLLEEARDDRIGGTGLPHDRGTIRQHVAVSAETASELEAHAGYRDAILRWMSSIIRGSPERRSTNRLPLFGE